MNSRQNNKLASYVAVEAVLKTTNETSDIAGLPAKLTTLSSKLGEIHTLARTQTRPIDGKTAGRERVFQAMAELAVEVATAVATHADEHQLDDLARLVKITEADFARARVSHRLWLAERVVESAQTVLPALASRGVSADTLQELQARINAAHENLHEPRTTVAAKKAATLRLVVLFDEVDALLEGQIDRMVFPLRKTSPEFYAAYQAARSIVNRTGSSRDSRESRDASPAVRNANSERRSAAPSDSPASPPSPTAQPQAA